MSTNRARLAAVVWPTESLSIWSRWTTSGQQDSGIRDILTVKDVSTGLKWPFPVPTKSGDDTTGALQQFCGHWRVKALYLEHCPEIADACRRLGSPTKPHNGGSRKVTALRCALT